MDKKKKKKIDEKEADIGTVMTVSLFLILLTFFILLNSIAVLDDNRVRLAIGSLIGAFGGLPGGLSPMEVGKSILPPTAPMMEEELNLQQLLNYMKLKPRGWVGEIKIETVGDKEIITINQDVLLTKDGSEINPSISTFLNKLCRIINEDNYPVEIIGHTDNIQASEKKYRSNWEVSALTAMQLEKYFVYQGAVSPKRINAYGSGSYRQASSNATRQSRAQNRRVEIILHTKSKAYIRRIFKKKPHGFFTYKKFDFKVY